MQQRKDQVKQEIQQQVRFADAYARLELTVVQLAIVNAQQLINRMNENVGTTLLGRRRARYPDLVV